MNRTELIEFLADKCADWHACIFLVTNLESIDAWIFQNRKGIQICVDGDDGGLISESDWKAAKDKKGA